MKKVIFSAIMAIASIVSVNAQSYNPFSSTSRSSRNSYGSIGSVSRRSSSMGFGTSNSSVRYQSGYTRSNGTYVSGHYKTNSNYTNHDNFSTYGNTNPFTGSNGSRARDYSSSAYNYGSGRTIQTGPRGGQYYTNSQGNRVYVPKRY